MTTPKASPSGNQFSAWNKTAENNDAGKEACGAGGGWGSIKQFDDKKASDGNGAPGVGGNWDRAKPFNANQLSDWSSREKKDWSSGKPLGEAPAGNVSDDAYAGGGDSWSKPGLLGARPAETNNWNEARSSGWKQNSPASEGKAGTNDGNWSKPKTFSGGNQSSGWGNDKGESWTKPNSIGGQSSWSDHTDGFNGGEGGDQSGGWGRGRNDQSCGGRGNSFSGRGRGRGRNLGGCRWSGGRGGNQEGNGSGDQPEFFSRGNTFASGQSSSWNQAGFASGGGSWNQGNESAGEHTGKNAGETADKGSWDSWKSESGKQTGGWAKQDSKAFEAPAADGSNKSGGGNWDQPKQSGNSGGSRTSGGWNTSAVTAKEDGGIGSSSKEADIGGDGSAWEKKAAGSWGNPKDGNIGGKGGW
ncbi:protein RNA-directed DNA methylation 3 isoform X2 [Iris pallida]|uniref:Protein RNA-directed DNA methylation 3 isoform X2 n=1 Tax=Iris pallida TaxID=29817 RepID=A0AAX6HGA4_IRIPA|nr:protein RNA-directed DNA methylation 3 isoform X2 [Iris pallida]